MCGFRDVSVKERFISLLNGFQIELSSVNGGRWRLNGDRLNEES